MSKNAFLLVNIVVCLAFAWISKSNWLDTQYQVLCLLSMNESTKLQQVETSAFGFQSFKWNLLFALSKAMIGLQLLIWNLLNEYSKYFSCEIDTSPFDFGLKFWEKISCGLNLSSCGCSSPRSWILTPFKPVNIFVQVRNKSVKTYNFPIMFSSRNILYNLLQHHKYLHGKKLLSSPKKQSLLTKYDPLILHPFCITYENIYECELHLSNWIIPK